MWAVNQWWKGGAEGELYIVGERKRQKEGKRKTLKKGKGESKKVRDRKKEGGREGGAGLTSAWFNILRYSVLRASRVTRTRPS